MKKLLSYILVIGILAGMLTMTGCKKKKADATDPSGQTLSTDGALGTDPTENDATQWVTGPTQSVIDPSTSSDPTETTVSDCDHVTGGWVVEKTSTCTTEGSRHKVCSLCGDKVEVQPIPTVPHSPGQWKVDQIATCKVEGRQHQMCTQCDSKIITVNIAKAAHKETTVRGHAATATATGLTDGKKCTVCGEITLPQYVIPAGNGAVSFAYERNSDGRTCSIAALDHGTTGNVTVPGTFAGYTVTGIGDGAFADCTGITGITLPASVTSIGDRAFNGCTGLTKIVFEGTSAQWNAISKGADWDTNTGTYIVTFTK